MLAGDGSVKLFDVIPGNFFSVLSSGNREIYYDALMILHDLFKFELNILLDDYNKILENGGKSNEVKNCSLNVSSAKPLYFTEAFYAISDRKKFFN